MAADGNDKVPDDLDSLTAEIRRLVEKLDAPKKKDWTEKIVALTPFLSTVLLAAVSLWLTWSYQQAQNQIAQTNAQHEKAFQDAQVRVAELDAISKLIPSLSSNDPVVRKRAEELLQAVQQARPTSFSDEKAEPTKTGEKNESDTRASNTSVITTFALILENDKAAEPARIDAAQKIAKASTAPGTSPAERRQAEEVLTRVANSNAPPEVKKAAQFAIADIRHVDIEQIAELVKAEPVTRHIDEVILHHSYAPKISDYKGYPTILAIANAQLERFQWGSVGFHYIVAPDGTIWIGVPLNGIAYHAAQKNPTTVGVLLIMNGDEELPTTAQQKALVQLLNALFAKLKIKPTDNFAPGHGFHRDYNSGKTCPGTKMTKELVLSWLNPSPASN